MSAEERNVELRRLNREEASGRPDSTWGTGDAAPDEHVLPSRRMTVRVVAFVIVLLIVLGGAFGATAYYARGAYYVGFENGGDRVTIFKGRPGSLLWFKPTVEEPTTVTRSAVPPSRVDDLTNGREFATIDEARSYVRNLAPPSTTTTSAPPTTTEPTPTSAP